MNEKEIIEYVTLLATMSDDRLFDEKDNILLQSSNHYFKHGIRYWVNKLTILNVVIESRGIYVMNKEIEVTE